MRPNALKETFTVCSLELAFLFPEDTFVLRHDIYLPKNRLFNWWRGTGTELLNGLVLEDTHFDYVELKGRIDSGEWLLKHVKEV